MEEYMAPNSDPILKATWKSIYNALARLGPDGISDDDTDNESPVKRVRRIQPGFLNRQFSDLFAALDTYPIDGVALKKDKRGNRRLERIPTSTKTNHSRSVERLPGNWYDQTWLLTLKRWQVKKLGLRPDMDIPTLAPHTT